MKLLNVILVLALLGFSFSAQAQKGELKLTDNTRAFKSLKDCLTTVNPNPDPGQVKANDRAIVACIQEQSYKVKMDYTSCSNAANRVTDVEWKQIAIDNCNTNFPGDIPCVVRVNKEKDPAFKADQARECVQGNARYFDKSFCDRFLKDANVTEKDFKKLCVDPKVPTGSPSIQRTHQGGGAQRP